MDLEIAYNEADLYFKEKAVVQQQKLNLSAENYVDVKSKINSGLADLKKVVKR